MSAKKGFTLTEILIVVIILGIMASFAIPGYNKTVTRGRIREATTNLISIHAANNIYRSERGMYWPQGATFGLVDINSNLRLSIMNNPAVTYSCTGAALGVTYSCTATDTVNFTVTVDQRAIDNTIPNPWCTDITVDSCP